MLKEQGAVAAAAGAYRMAERLAPGESDAARHLAALAPVMA
jgi:cytochrome c-type biogenesis protein CcmH/NrfG